MSGPCLTDAATETAPGGLFVGRKPLCGGPNVNLSGRCGSLRRWCHLHLSIRTCHDVRSSASWRKSVSRLQQSVSTVSIRVTPHPSPLLAVGAPQDRHELGDLWLQAAKA